MRVKAGGIWQTDPSEALPMAGERFLHKVDATPCRPHDDAHSGQTANGEPHE